MNISRLCYIMVTHPFLSKIFQVVTFHFQVIQNWVLKKNNNKDSGGLIQE
uniref:Uncharacterized protein n=1 Tax=Rhizophora mucronata TaxID=61149 RepID=A0A2P2L0B7_RHIMU